MPRRPPPPPSNSRRRLLVALGFGAANVALLKSMSGGDSQSVELSSGGAPVTTIPSAGSSSSTTVVDRPLTEPPAMADAGPEVDPATHVFDVVISGGRVIDPMSGFDGLLDVGINGSVITAIAPPGLTGTTVIDATDKVVAPGFVDILSYEPNQFGVWFKVADGVTTNLAMHGVNNYANAFFDRYAGATPIHFGGAFHQHFMRGEDIGAKPDKPLDEAQLTEFAELTASNLANGLAGVAFSPEYSPATTTEELNELGAVAKEYGHVAFFHTRSSDPASSQAGVIEAVNLGRNLGIPVHIEHITSTGGTSHMQETLAILDRARAEGIDATACVYPYNFWATTLASFRFAGDWQARYGITYEDLQIAGTETRLTESTFAQAQAENLLVAAHGSIPEAELQLALQRDWVMLGSDAILTESLNNHPRASGTFSRMLGHYVRDLGLVDLPSGLAKMTSLPTQRVEGMIPAMRRKGRLQRGADADVTIFDPATVGDRATVSQPDLPATGIEHVMVDGQFVMTAGAVQRTVLPGRPLQSG